MKDYHAGIPTVADQPGEMYLARDQMCCTDHESNPFGIQWVRFETDCALPDLVKTVPDVAFAVDNLQAELAVRQVLVEPNSSSDGFVVPFIVSDGAPMELLQLIGDAGLRTYPDRDR